jgi:anhydro-N-acetylmuramic acid kinase
MKKPLTKRNVLLGLMSGTSCDGLDIVAVAFDSYVPENYDWQLLAAATIPYDRAFAERLKQAKDLDLAKLMQLEVEFTRFMGDEVNRFLSKNQIEHPIAIASHGHTVLHRPDLGYTHQIGSGAHLHAITGLPVICNFRQQDVALGGQGAPLVPIGDRMLFGEYSSCMNIGGFANISIDMGRAIQAFDICPVNIVLNDLAGQLGLPYDRDGLLAAKGKISADLLEALNALDYYAELAPKSLGKEWVVQNVWPLLKGAGNGHLAPEDLLATMTAHAGFQIGKTLHNADIPSVLMTGGGVYNATLLAAIQQHAQACQLVRPSDDIVNYKEAIIFAFLGLRYLEGKFNVLSQITGARKDHCSGICFGLFQKPNS